MAEKVNPLSFVTFLDAETVPEFNVNDAATQHKVDSINLYIKKFGKDIAAKYSESLSGKSLTDVLMMKPEDLKKPDKEILKKVTDEHWKSNAALYAEFGKIVCISIGKLHTDGKFYIKSFCGRDEKKILIQLAEALANGISLLCAHNGKEFDFPFIKRRYIINGLPIPGILNDMGKKPWELQLEDTMELWSGTQWKYKVSLELLAHVLGLPSPKQEMDGSKVAELYYSMFHEGKTEELPWEREAEVLSKISTYCNGDVFTLANVYARIKGYETLASFEVIQANPPQQ